MKGMRFRKQAKSNKKHFQSSYNLFNEERDKFKKYEMNFHRIGYLSKRLRKRANILRQLNDAVMTWQISK